jgi:hypothetical protein
MSKHYEQNLKCQEISGHVNRNGLDEKRGFSYGNSGNIPWMVAADIKRTRTLDLLAGVRILPEEMS